MKTLRNTLLGACLALPLTAAAGHAQTIEQDGRVIQVPPGAVVLILPGPGPATASPATASSAVAPVFAAPRITAAPAALPMLRLIAQQQADMQRMIADMNALFPPMPMMPAMPDPSQLIRAAFGAGGPMLTLAGGPGVCSESISIVQHGNSAPVVTRQISGGACGAAATGKPESVRDIPATPELPPHGPKVLDISYPPQPVQAGVPHT